MNAYALVALFGITQVKVVYNVVPQLFRIHYQMEGPTLLVFVAVAIFGML